MKKGLTELVFIIDRSGSMCGLESDTIGGFNAMLKEQQAVEGEAFVTTVLFDDKYELLHDRIDIKALTPLTDKDYTVRGTTALLDAVGKTIHKIRKVQKSTTEDYRAEKVMFIILTDGQENASREYSADRIKKRIGHQKEKYGWEFIFIGANMDAVAEAGKLGIAADRAQNYSADGNGTSVAYTAMTFASTAFRNGKGLGDWANSIKSNSSCNPQSAANRNDAKKALANLNDSFRGLKGAEDEPVDVVNNAGGNDGLPDADHILKGVLEEELRNLQANGGDEMRIKELQRILKHSYRE